MRILILHSQVPFAYGGAEVLVDGLKAALSTRGHQVDVVSLPYRWNPPERLFRSILAWRLLDLEAVDGRAVDLVICTKFPSWAVKHPNKALWLVHQHRQAYDLYGTPLSDIKPQQGGDEIREGILRVDRVGIGECGPRYAISANVAGRLRAFTGLEADVLYPPVETRDLWPEAYEPFVLSASRLDDLKRVRELIQAWPHVSQDLSLVVASDGPLRDELKRMAEKLGVSRRIEFVGRVSDDELSRLFRTCRAVYYAPVDEDYGYVTVEAHAAGKPVVAAPDSGGVLEFVRHGETGQITRLDTESLAAAINQYAVEDLAREHGERGRRETPRTSWDEVVASLLGGGR